MSATLPSSPIEYAHSRRPNSLVRGRRLANAAFACALASALIVCVSMAAESAFRSLVPGGQDADQFNPTWTLSTLHELVELGPLALATLLAGCIFAIVGLTQHRSARTWLALAANVALPAALIWAYELV